MVLTQFSKEYIKRMLRDRKSAIDNNFKNCGRIYSNSKISIQGRKAKTKEEWMKERQVIVDCINRQILHLNNFL